MKAISFFFLKFKLVCVFLAFTSLISQQVNLISIILGISGKHIAINFVENAMESEEKIEETESISEYLIPFHFLNQLNFQNFNQFHSCHFLYYYLIKQFAFEVIVQPPKPFEMLTFIA